MINFSGILHCSCPFHCSCAPSSCFSPDCKWCANFNSSAVWTHRRLVARATSHLPKWDIEWSTAVRSVREAWDGSFGPCGRLWTERALRYRLLQGYHHTAAALTVLPYTPAKLDETSSCFHHPFTSLISALSVRQPFPAQCTDPSHSPFNDMPPESFASQLDLGTGEWGVWLEWIAKTAGWIGGPREGREWDDWPWGHIARSPIQYVHSRPTLVPTYYHRPPPPPPYTPSTILWVKNGELPNVPYGYMAYPAFTPGWGSYP